MVRRASVAVCLTAVLALAFGAAFPTAAPVRLARHPDYHGGKVVFSYLGDIWMANEDGSNVHRLTDNLAREVYPRFSPDGRSIAFSSNRYGNNDVYVIAVGRRRAEAADLPHRRRRRRRLDARLRAASSSAPPAATAPSRPSRRSIRSPAKGGQEQSLNLDWGYWGSFSPDGKSLVFNRHPATWSRRHYRGSYAADLWIADVAAKSYTKLLGDEQYNRYWPMWGADGSIYFVGDPLPNEKGVDPGQPGRAEERQQHLQDSGQGRTADAGDPAHRRQPLLAVDVQRRQGHRLRGQLRHLEAGRRVRARRAKSSWTSPPTKRRTRSSSRRSRTRSTRSTSRRRAAARSSRRADRSSRSRPSAATSRASRRTRWRRATRRRSGPPTASSSRSSRIAPDATRSGSATPKAARRRRSPTSTTRRARSCGRRIRRRSSTRPPTGSSTATTSPTARRRRRLERRRPHRVGRRVARQQVDRVLQAGSDASLARLHRADRGRRGAPRLRRQPALFRDQRHLDRRRALPRLHVLRRREQRHRVAGRHQHDDGAVGAVAARSGSRSDESRHRQRGAGARRRSGGAAEHGPRRRGRRRAGAGGSHRLERPGAPRAAALGSGNGDRRAHRVARRSLGRADGVDRRRRWRPRRRAGRRRRGSTSSTSRAAS